MSELDAGRTREQAAKPITTLAIGKLRTLGRRAPSGLQGEGRDNGLGDAFAEVFARIASAPPPRSPHSAWTSADSAASQPSPANTSSSQRADEPSDTEPTEQTNDLLAPPDANAVAGDPSASSGANDQDPWREPDESAAESSQALVGASADGAASGLAGGIQSTHAQAATPAADGDDKPERRNRPHATAVAESETPDPEPRNSHTAGPPQTSAAEANAPGQPESHEPAGPEFESRDAESSLDRGDDRGVQRDDPGNHASGSLPAKQTRAAQPASAVSSPALASESIASDSAIKSAAAKPTSASAEAAVSSIQGVASSAIGSDTNRTSAGSHATSLAKSAGQAIDPNSPSRGLSSDRAARPAGGTHASDAISRVKLIQRVSKAFQHLGPEGGVIRLRLAPSELGSVRVEMRVKQRKVEARVVAETDAAGAALREHLPELRQRLESQRMQVERLEIEVEQGETEFGGQTGRRDPRDMPDPDGHRPRAPRPSAEIASRRPSPPPTTEPGPRLVTVDGRRGVDVRL